MKKALILRAEYHDSVVLMRIAAEIKTLPGINEAALFMGSPANHAILDAAGLASAYTADAGPDDLIISLSALDETTADAGLAKARELLSAKAKKNGERSDIRAHTLDGAVKMVPEANLACFSIPGQYVAYEASKALDLNLNLFIFSDNVPIADEVGLKRKALGKGLLCMGPDCGTAWVNGYGLGFCNAVPRGRVGLVASSGTGLQAVACGLAACGEGVSQGIGVGGRDLTPAVGGLMTLAVLKALDDDPATEAIVLIAKEPHPDVAPALENTLASLKKPVVPCCLGFTGTLAGKPVAENLDEAVAMALTHLGVAHKMPAAMPHDRAAQLRPLAAGRVMRLLGLYTGGTLAHEAQHVLEKSGISVSFGEDDAQGRRILDLGDDKYTTGRPHPMIDPGLRNEMLARLKLSGETLIFLFDLVLGRGSHPDPAQDLARAITLARKNAEAADSGFIALGSIIGTKDDYQGYERQKSLLQEAGATLLPTNRAAAETAALLLKSPDTETL